MQRFVLSSLRNKHASPYHTSQLTAKSRWQESWAHRDQAQKARKRQIQTKISRKRNATDTNNHRNLVLHVLDFLKKNTKNILIFAFSSPLRANFCNYRECGVSREILDFFIFCPNNLYSELFSKIPFKGSGALSFFRNREKFEKRHFGFQPLPKLGENDAFCFRSYRWTR